VERLLSENQTLKAQNKALIEKQSVELQVTKQENDLMKYKV
jgi:hypothetical protein